MKVVVVGHGMVGARLVADLCASADPSAAALDVTVLGAEDHAPYNRVLLSEVVAGTYDIASISTPGVVDPRVSVWTGVAAVAIDRDARAVVDSTGGRHRYDALVLATGAAARVPDLPGVLREAASAAPAVRAGAGAGGAAAPAARGALGAPGPGCGPVPGAPVRAARTDAAASAAALVPGVHVLRSIDDAREIVAASLNARHAVVLGAGVLGIEVAVGLAGRPCAACGDDARVDVQLVHPRGLMNAQLDAVAGEAAADAVARLGVHVRTGVGVASVTLREGRLAGVVLDDGAEVPADLLVLTAGTVPETALARGAGLDVDRGVVVGPDLTTPADPRVFAIGDCAQPPEGGSGLVARGWDQARRLAATLLDRASQLSVDSQADRIASSGPAGGVVPRPQDREGPAAGQRPGVRAGAGPRVTRPRGPAPGGSGDAGAPQVVPARPPVPGGSADTDAAVAPIGAAAPGAGVAVAGGASAGGAHDHAVDPDAVVKVKGRGVDIVAMGISGSRRPPACDEHPRRTVRLGDPDAGRHVEVVVQGGRVVGATCVGAGPVAADLVAAFTRGTPVPRDPAQLLLRAVGPVAGGVDSPVRIPDRTTICRCNGVTKGALVQAWRDGNRTVDDVARATRATTGCGGCTEPVCGILDWLRAAEPPEPEPAAAPALAAAPAAAEPVSASVPAPLRQLHLTQWCWD